MKIILLVLFSIGTSLYSQVNESNNFILYSSFPSGIGTSSGAQTDVISNLGLNEIEVSSNNYALLPSLSNYVTPIANINRGNNKVDSNRKTSHNIGSFGDGEKITLNAYGGEFYKWSTGETTKSIQVTTTKDSIIWLETRTQANEINAIKSSRDSIQYSVSKLVIAGNIYDKNNDKIAESNGLKVILSGSKSDTFTSLDGKYSFGVTAGTYNLSVSHPDYTFTGPNQANPRIITNASSTIGNDFIGEKVRFNISGVINEIGGTFLGGVEIRSQINAIDTSSTVDGTYKAKLTQGSYTITPNLAGYIFTPNFKEIKITNADLTNINFDAEKIGATYNLYGNVSNTIGNTPIPNAQVIALSTTGSLFPKQTDSSGNYSLSLPNGTYTINATKQDWIFIDLPKQIIINSSNVTQDIQGYQIPNATLCGFVLLDSNDINSGVSGVNISFVSSVTSSTQTNNGKFSRSLKKDTYDIIPSHPDYYFEPPFYKVNLVSDTCLNPFIAKLKTNGPSCIRMRDTVIPNVYVFPPFRASKAKPLIFENNCPDDVVINSVEIEAGKDQFILENVISPVNIKVPKFKDYKFDVRFMPNRVGKDSIKVTIKYLNQTNNSKYFATAMVRAEGELCDASCSYTKIKLVAIPDSALPGTLVRMNLVATPFNTVLQNGDKFKFKIKYKKELIADLKYYDNDNKLKFAPIIGGIVNENRIDIEPYGFIETSIVDEFKYFQDNKDILMRFEFIATLGSIDSTILKVQEFEWTSGNIKAEIIEDGIFRIIPCEAGGSRFIDWKILKTSTTIQALAPNPVGDELNLIVETTKEKDIANIQIFSILGSEVFSKSNISLSKGTNEVNLILSNLQAGTYRLTLNNEQYILFIKE